MHRLWRAAGGRHHPDLHLNWLSETCFDRRTGERRTGARWRKTPCITGWHGAICARGVQLSILNSNAWGFVHKLLLDEV